MLPGTAAAVLRVMNRDIAARQRNPGPKIISFLHEHQAIAVRQVPIHSANMTLKG
jgi:hypothetical protein